MLALVNDSVELLRDFEHPHREFLEVLLRAAVVLVGFAANLWLRLRQAWLLNRHGY
jgi:hypothetical protein